MTQRSRAAKVSTVISEIRKISKMQSVFHESIHLKECAGETDVRKILSGAILMYKSGVKNSQIIRCRLIKARGPISY